MDAPYVRWIRSGSPDVDAVLAFAARELGRYGRLLTGVRWDVRPGEHGSQKGNTLWLGICDQTPPLPDGRTLTPAQWDDGFAAWMSDHDLYIAGRNERSVLFGVYAFLERQGVRFLRPGHDGEVIPHVETLSFPTWPIVEEARYRHRGVCVEGAPSLAHALEMVDWCAKKRMNTVFLQFLSSRYFYDLWYKRPYNPQYADAPLTEAEALAYDDQVIQSMKRRGMVFHRVGHGWTSAAFGMPRSGWVQATEPVEPQYVRWLAEVNGERALYEGIPINTELCYSYQPAFDAFVENVIQYCEDHPELDVVHVWLSDATNNKCECDDCRQLSISDWYAKIVNALSEALHQRVPGTRFVFLCYIELLWPPEQVAIDEEYGNAIMMFAPIARCYGHSLADPACDDEREWPRPPLNQFAVSRHNAFYVQALHDWRQAFQGDGFDFDYHLMWAVWRQWTDTHLAWVFHEDLGHLQELGLDGIVSCQSFRAFYPSGLAMTVLAEALWDPDMPWTEMRRGYLEAAYGQHADFADDYLEMLESFLDTGDPHWRTPPLSNADSDRLDQVTAFIEISLAEIELRRRSTFDRAQDRSLDLLAHHARLLGFLVAAYQAHLAGEKEAASQAFDRAAAFLRDTEPEYSTYIDAMLALQALQEARQAVDV